MAGVAWISDKFEENRSSGLSPLAIAVRHAVMRAVDGSGIMLSLMKPGEERIFFRRVVNCMAKIQIGADARQRDCLVIDISDGGVRLYVDFDVPGEFVLIFPGDGIIVQETTYRVIWRRDHEVGCKFVSAIRRPRFAMRDK